MIMTIMCCVVTYIGYHDHQHISTLATFSSKVIHFNHLCSMLPIWLLFVLISSGWGAISALPESNDRKVTIFQAVDSSFMPIWINWWVIAISFNVVPQNWGLYIACFDVGDGKRMNETISHFHRSGCQHIVSGNVHKKRVYYAKWKSVARAFHDCGTDLLLIDIDAFLIRNPIQVLRLDKPLEDWSIVASRDHGPPELEHAQNWGNARICTGFVYFKRSQDTLDLVDYTLQRVAKYGHDQIQFNKALARGGMTWSSAIKDMDSDKTEKEGFLPWMHQTNDVDFLVSPEDRNNLQRGELPPNAVKLKLLLLNKFQALRYCSKALPSNTDFSKNLRVDDFIPGELRTVNILHCFVDTGPHGEQGLSKSNRKTFIMKRLYMWGAKDYYHHSKPSLGASKEVLVGRNNIDVNHRDMDGLNSIIAISGSMTGVSLTDAAGRKRFLEIFADPAKVKNIEAVWLNGTRLPPVHNA